MAQEAIMTKYLPCTNSAPRRIKAFCDSGNLILIWDYGLNIEENHTRAAEALADKLGWEWHHVGGRLPSNIGGYVFIKKI